MDFFLALLLGRGVAEKVFVFGCGSTSHVGLADAAGKDQLHYHRWYSTGTFLRNFWA